MRRPAAVRERNVVIKDRRKAGLKFALAYPSPYDVGMSNLAVRLLYELINSRNDLCERFFFTGYGDLPRSLESRMPLTEYDVVGFSVQHEMDYVRMLDMLSSSGIPLRREDRRGPVILAGGPAVTSNPLPLAAFVDYFVMGEVEQILDRMLDALAAKEPISSIPGIYSYGSPAERIYVRDLDRAYHAVNQVHAVSGGGFTSTFLLEISRGCHRGCRFCMECFIYRPMRERSLGAIRSIVGQIPPGLKRVTCISSAFFDHSQLPGVLSELKARGLGFSFPSIRISQIPEDVLDLLVSGGQRTITLAPETPSERLRRVINKRFTDDQLIALLSAARRSGIRSVKLYFMIGIPGETASDLSGLRQMLSGVLSAGFSPESVHISINPMIPKSNTPFQWAPLVPEEEYKERLAVFRRACSDLRIRRIESMDYRWGAVQAYLSTAGSDAWDILEAITLDLRTGGQGDLGAWRRVLKASGKDFRTIYRPWPEGAPLPWEMIKGAMPESILLDEYRRAVRGNDTDV